MGDVNNVVYSSGGIQEDVRYTMCYLFGGTVHLMSDIDERSMSGEASPKWFKQRKWFMVGVIVLSIIVIVGCVFLANSNGSNSSSSKPSVSSSEANGIDVNKVIDNESVHASMVKILTASVDNLFKNGGEMNYFVKGNNMDLSVYNPGAIVGQKAASYLSNSDGKGGYYQPLPDEHNFTTQLADKYVPKLNDTFTLWSWNGDKDYNRGYFIGDVGVECKSPNIGEKPTFKLCKNVVPKAVWATVENGLLVQVDDRTDVNNKTIRTVDYGITAAVDGVLENAYKTK